jgi:hypothetical protein
MDTEVPKALISAARQAAAESRPSLSLRHGPLHSTAKMAAAFNDSEKVRRGAARRGGAAARGGEAGGGEDDSLRRKYARAQVFAVAVHPERPLLAIGTEANVVKLYNLQTLEYERPLPQVGWVMALDFSPCGACPQSAAAPRSRV